MEHPNAVILRAIADGKEIQYKYSDSDDWCDYAVLKSLASLLNGAGEFTWRVKPEKKKGWINIYKKESCGKIHPTKELADKAQESYFDRIACIEIEYEEG